MSNYVELMNQLSFFNPLTDRTVTYISCTIPHGHPVILWFNLLHILHFVGVCFAAPVLSSSRPWVLLCFYLIVQYIYVHTWVYYIYWLVQINGLIHWKERLHGQEPQSTAGSFECLPLVDFMCVIRGPTGFFKKKNSHPPTCCHITPDPPAPPWSMLLPNACRHPNRNCVFWRPFQAKWCNNIELGEKGHASFFTMSVTGWLFFEEPGSRSCCFGWSLHFMLHCISFLPLAALKESIRA